MNAPSSSLLSFLSSFLLISWVNFANTHDNFLDCLRSHISDSDVIYTPKNTTYESILQSAIYNLRFTTESTPKPRVIITPSHESQIQAVIYCSKKHSMQIRVRSGGHDYEGLSSTSDQIRPFVIIDLRNLRSITVDTKKKTAWIEAGATVGEVHYAISQKSKTLTFVAGDCSTVGVGGLFSGGGTSPLSRKYGIAADNIIDAKIIDVNGQILDKKSMGDDLFWAIRGGGSASFGVITAYKVRLVTVPENVTVFNVIKTLEQNATEIVHQWQDIAAKIDENLIIRIFFASVNSSQSGKRTVQATFISVFLGGIDDLLVIMQKSFPELGLVKENCIEMSWIESVLVLANFPQNAPTDVLLDRKYVSRSYYKGKSDYVTSPISEDGLRGIWRRLNEEDESVLQMLFNPYGGKIAKIPESEIPFPHRAGNIYAIEYQAIWEDNSEASRHLNSLRELYSYMAPYVSQSPRRAYCNYRDLDLGINNIGNTSYIQASKWGKRYFHNNFKRLVQVKTNVDPTNFFRNEQSIPSLAP